MQTARPHTILVVQPHVMGSVVMQQLLESSGHVVDVVATATEALQAASCRRFSLLITDLHLPDLSGYDLFGLLRAGRPALQGIAISDDPEATDCQNALAFGFRRYVGKPVDGAELLKAVEGAGGRIGQHDGRPDSAAT